jgi:outer membrane protein TolC
MTACTSEDAALQESAAPAPLEPLERAPTTQAAAEKGADEVMERPSLSPTGPISLTVEGAIVLSLENNEELRVQRETPQIRSTAEDVERAAFDPVLSGEFNIGRTKSLNFPLQIEPGLQQTDVTSYAGGFSLEELLPTGTKFSLDGSTSYQNNSLFPSNLAGTRAGASVTQSLLRGAGVAVNLVNLHQARLDTQISEFEFRGFAEALVAQVEETYWDYALAIRKVEIFESSVKVAEQQLDETNTKIQVGKLPETERAAAQAEVAKRREDLIAARSDRVKTRLKLLRLLNPDGENPWSREVAVLNKPFVPTAPLEAVENHVQVALRLRPDLNEARLGVKRADLDIVKTKNGVLPKLDFFVTLGTTGYATEFGNTFHNIDGKNYDISAGAKFEYALLTRAERSQERRAVFSEQQALRAVDNLAQLVEVDVRTAYVDVEKAKEQITATTATRELRQEALRAEREKFDVGKSTSFLVAQAQRDVIASQIDEVEAVVNHLKALVELYRLEGSLLERRGVSTPGLGTVALPRSR